MSERSWRCQWCVDEGHAGCKRHANALDMHAARRPAPWQGSCSVAAMDVTTSNGSFVRTACRVLMLCWMWAIGLHASAASDPAVLYHNYCSVCHGDKGDGRSRATGSLSTLPRDFTSAASKTELSPERIALAIAQGRPGTAMVGWKTQLSDNDIQGLAEFVHQRFVLGHGVPAGAAISGTKAHGGREADVAPSRGREADVASPRDRNSDATASAPVVRVDMTVGLPNGLKGDAKRGGVFYLANCATCHGTRGDGAGPRAYFINPKPRNFVEDASRARLNRAALYAAVSEGRNGSEMPAWKQVSTPQQIADVAEYVFRSFIQPQPQAAAR
jgi:mono/diheme cytochrome c family protein